MENPGWIFGCFCSLRLARSLVFWEKTGIGPSCFIHERDGKEVAMGLEELLAPGFPQTARVKLCDLGRRYFSLSP